MPTHPCRLAVFFARSVAVGVILRRGPSEWAQLVRWDRSNDHFEPGQWFRGRVYERRCDLSPDGKFFVYFAAKHGPRNDPDDIGEAWTAISRPPYFTALALWQNVGSWYGGGYFEANDRVLLDATCSLEPHPKFAVPPLEVGSVPAETAPWEQRLMRDGWHLVERGFDPRTHRRVGRQEIWVKRHPETQLTLCRQIEDVDFARYGGPYADTFWLETGEDLVPLPGVSWADWDDWRRLILVRDGTLVEATWSEAGLASVPVFDANPLKPTEVIAPGWAVRWDDQPTA
jgi:hypothetical protein